GRAMITMLGSPRRCCDGLTRRETLKAGALSLLGGFFTLPSLLRAEEQSRARNDRPGKAKSVILLYLLGGAATQDMFDLKPDPPPRRVSRGFQAVPADRPGHPGLRTPAAHRPLDAQGGRRPLAQPQGRLPQLPAVVHRLRAADARPAPARHRPAEHGVGVRVP